MLKVKDLQRILSGVGALISRQTGSHQIWRFPNGETISLVLNKERTHPKHYYKNINKILIIYGVDLNASHI